MDCRPLGDLFELYLLGALSESDTAGIRLHLRDQCPACVAALHDAALTVFALLESLRPIPSTPKQRTHFLMRLKADRSKH